MGIRIISRGHRVETRDPHLSFELIECPGAGCSFPCDENGNVKMDELGDIAKENLAQAQASVGTKYHPPEIVVYQNRYWEPTVGQCHCGREVVLDDPLTNECPCGRLYNMCGQELKPREQWEECMDYEY